MLLLLAAAKYATKYIYIQLGLLRDCIIIKNNSIFFCIYLYRTLAHLSICWFNSTLTPHADRQTDSHTHLYEFMIFTSIQCSLLHVRITRHIHQLQHCCPGGGREVETGRENRIKCNNIMLCTARMRTYIMIIIFE